MSFTQVIKLKEGFTLQDAATEIQALNQLVGTLGINPETGEDYFPRPIQCNPDSVNQEGFLGAVNTPPDEYGRLDVLIDNYEYLDWSVLPVAPSTFTLVSGKPSTVAIFA